MHEADGIRRQSTVNTGRFASQNPGLHGTNWYVYCSDDPVNRLDTNVKADARSDLENFLGRFAIACIGLMIGYLVNSLVFNMTTSEAPIIVLGLIAAITTGMGGVFGPTLISDIRVFLKGLDDLDKSDGGSGAFGLAKGTVE